MEPIPIFARGGAVIPMWPRRRRRPAGYHPTAVELHLFVPSADGTHHSMLQEDDGLTFAALSGARYRTDFEVGRSGHTVVLRAEVAGDGYPEFARERFVLVLHGAASGRPSGWTVRRCRAPTGGSSSPTRAPGSPSSSPDDLSSSARPGRRSTRRSAA